METEGEWSQVYTSQTLAHREQFWLAQNHWRQAAGCGAWLLYIVSQTDMADKQPKLTYAMLLLWSKSKIWISCFSIFRTESLEFITH